jgi:hypothetical protein
MTRDKFDCSVTPVMSGSWCVMTLLYNFLPKAPVIQHIETAAVMDKTVVLFPFKCTSW